jgi:hypothetical protein
VIIGDDRNGHRGRGKPATGRPSSDAQRCETEAGDTSPMLMTALTVAQCSAVINIVSTQTATLLPCDTGTPYSRTLLRQGPNPGRKAEAQRVSGQFWQRSAERTNFVPAVICPEWPFRTTLVQYVVDVIDTT